MIEIKCTEEQKMMIINAIENMGGVCAMIDVDCETDICKDCTEQNIKWDIQPEPLKPCPCCGGEAKYISISSGTYIICSKCCLQTIAYRTEKQATEIWNRRTTS